LGERVAARFLRDNGCRILAVNYREKEVEIDLVVRDGDVLAFVEVKARDIRCPTPPGMAVDSAKRRRMARGALLYLRRLEYPRISWRFDIVEVWCEQGRVRAIRHLPDAFAMTAPCPYYGKSGADPTPRPGSDGTSRRSS
jgi:putative endonuclease